MATQKKRTQKIGSKAGAIFALLVLAWSIGSFEQFIYWRDNLLGIPVRTILEMLPSIFLSAWHVLQPCALVHLTLLQGLLEISVSCWQFVLTCAGVA